MSRDDFDDLFGEDDDFGDDFPLDDDDDFGFGDDDDDFDFDSTENLLADDDDDFGLDDDSDFAFAEDDLDDLDDFGLGTFDDDLSGDEFIDEEEGEGGTSRTFVILAAAMIFLFLIGIGLVIFLAVGGGTETNADRTRAAFESTRESIETANAQDLATANANATTDAIGGTETAEALVLTQTQEAIEEGTAMALTGTAEAEDAAGTETALAETLVAAQATSTPAGGLLDLPGTQTAQAENLTATAEAENDVTPTPPSVATQPPSSDIGATATALAQLLLTPIDTGPSPTPIGGDQPGLGDPPDGQDGGDPIQNELPNTGGLDDVGVYALMLVVLVGVILSARTVRATNARRM